MESPRLIVKPFANNGLRNEIPDSNGNADNAATYDNGFPSITMTPISLGGLPPRGRDMNGILYEISSHIAYQNRGNHYGFDASFAKLIGGYPKGSILIDDAQSQLYISVVDNNNVNFNSEDYTGYWYKYGLNIVDLEGMLPISGGYSNTRKYTAGELVFVDGNWYECYHPDGTKGKDPRDDINRPAGWTNSDESQPYYWLKIGKWLQLPETGAVLNYQKTTLREGIIKYRNDANLHKDKFWRLAEVYPDLVSGNYITIADLRGEFLRMLDDGRGVDSDRTVGSEQGDAIRNIKGTFRSFDAMGYEGSSGVFTDTIYSGTGKEGIKGASGTSTIGTDITVAMDVSKSVPTAAENRPRNIALLAATRI